MAIVKDSNISYLLGLAQTDGSLRESTRNRGCFSIELSIRDSDILFKLKDVIPFKVYLKQRTRDTNFKDNYTSLALKVYEKEFRDFLIANGVPVGCKSEIIAPIDCGEFEIDYIRGLMDGDGTIAFDCNGKPIISFTTKVIVWQNIL